MITALTNRIIDRDSTPDDTLVELLTANDITKPGKLSRREKEDIAIDIMADIRMERFLPQNVPLTSSFLQNVLDPVTSVIVPTGTYRVTMRKLLRLSLTQLQLQAEVMKLDVLDLDQEGIASLILINMDRTTPITRPLAQMLLAKEIAAVFGVRFQVPLRGAAHPSSTVSFTLRPIDMIRSTELTKNDLANECQNQTVSVGHNDDISTLATRLIAWWSSHPDQLREPFTPNFGRFLLQIARRHVSSS